LNEHEQWLAQKAQASAEAKVTGRLASLMMFLKLLTLILWSYGPAVGS